MVYDYFDLKVINKFLKAMNDKNPVDLTHFFTKGDKTSFKFISL